MPSRYSRHLVLASVAALGSLLGSAPLLADTYTYGVLQNLPCISAGCSGNVGLSGTISVNQLSTLTSDNFVAWNLSFVQGSSSPITLNQLNSSLSFSGSPTVTANTNSLAIQIAATGDSFMFLNRTAPIGQWIYGAVSAPLEAINVGGMLGVQSLSLPSTFLATRLGSVEEAPEPAVSLLVGLGGALVALRGYLERRRRSARS